MDLKFLNRSLIQFKFSAKCFCHWKGTGPRQVCPSTVWNVWILDFVQERIQDMSPGNFESAISKGRDSETEERLRVEEARSR